MIDDSLVSGMSEAHSLSGSETAALLHTDVAHGLDSREASERRERFGPNALPRPRRRSDLSLVWAQLRSPLVLILIVAGSVTLALGSIIDTAVIFGVVVVNAVIGVVQEGRAERALEALAAMTETSTHVIRDGARRIVPARDLVPGDLVALDAGDRVPADLRLVTSAELRINEAALTGESLPAAKAVPPVPPATDLGDRASMAWAGTLVVAGQGRGIATATASHTEVGRIQRLTASVEPLATPLTRQIDTFSRALSIIIVALAALTFAIGAARAEPVADSFIAAVALAVGAIPEGLPAAVTISLALGVSRMARRNAIVRRLPAVETLGSTTTIGTDKTGTITRNEMTVRAVVAGGARLDLASFDAGPGPALSPAAEATLRAGILANDAHLDVDAGTAAGDPTEVALLGAAIAVGMDPERVRAECPRADVLPFASERQLMATAHPGADGGDDIVYVKGAPEVVIRRCATQIDASGDSRPVDQGAALGCARRMGDEGMRVLAMARLRRARSAGPLATSPLDALELLGLQAMIDPPRPAVRPAIAECLEAGITVKMITGDQPGTAGAIARAVGLGGSATEPRVATGRELDDLDGTELQDLAAETDVFARVTPEHKLRLVTALQGTGAVVAMTGDGVNDAPALRQADIGVAMGETGTDAARAASDLVLLDDDFATIAAAVEEGRRVFDNITKFITWTLPTNLSEGLVILAAVLANVSLPITPLQILWINMVTAVALGLMLAFEPAEPGLMSRPPRRPGRPILSRSLVERIVLVAVLLLAATFSTFSWVLSEGGSLAEARTVAVNAFVAGEIAYLFNCRSVAGSSFRQGLFSNPFIWVGVLTTVALQIAFTYAPPMQAAFDTAPIGLREWGVVALVGVLVAAAVATEKVLRARVLGSGARVP